MRVTNISEFSNIDNNSHNYISSSIRDSISGSRIDMATAISDKLKILIANNGIEYLKHKAFVNALADYQLFVNANAYKNALLLMLENGLIERLIQIDYTLYKLEIDRFCDEYAVQQEVVYCLSEAIALSMDKTAAIKQNDTSIHSDFQDDGKTEWNYFIPGRDGNFIPATNIPESGSFNDVAKALGHDANQYFTYMPPYSTGINDVFVMFESFTGNILYVYVTKKTKRLDPAIIKHVLKEYSFTEEYDFSKYCDDIEVGIQKGNLTKEFFKKILNQDSDIMIDSRFNVKLIFENGKLVQMTGLDSLSKEAKSFRDSAPQRYNQIRKYAESFNFSQELVFREINLQVEAFVNMPLSLFDKFSDFFVEANEDVWSINYVMCAVALAKKQINFEEFKLISHEEYSNVGEFTTNGGVNVTACSYLDYVCLFDRDNGNFICCSKNGEDISPTSNINMTYLDKF